MSRYRSLQYLYCFFGACDWIFGMRTPFLFTTRFQTVIQNCLLQKQWKIEFCSYSTIISLDSTNKNVGSKSIFLKAEKQ